MKAFTTTILLFAALILTANTDDCIYTDTDGSYCNCDGTDKKCLVALVNWEECGDTASQLQILVGQCIKSKAEDEKHAAFKHSCSGDNEVKREWFSNEDCSGPTSKIEALSTTFQPCANIQCVKATIPIKEDVTSSSGNKISIYAFILSTIIIIII
eukprot:296757_1